MAVIDVNKFAECLQKKKQRTKLKGFALHGFAKHLKQEEATPRAILLMRKIGARLY